MTKSKYWLSLLTACLFCAVAAHCQAAVITYQGTLSNGVPAADSVSAAGTFDDPVTGRFWSFFGNQGDTVTITVARLEGDLDPGLWIFEGVFTDTTQFAAGTGSNIDPIDPGFLVFADDEIPNPGPFGDPQAIVLLTLPGTGQYTAIVTNVLSGPNDGGDGRFNYQITATNIVNQAAVPEPSSIVLLGFGAIGFAGAAFRRRRLHT